MIGVGLALFVSSLDSWDEFIPESTEETFMSEEVPVTFMFLNQLAATAAEDNNGSFEGACTTLMIMAEGEGIVTCNDTETAWALEIETESGSRFCADTTTPGKEIFVPLGDKTECVAL
jgi:hypothetical protein